ncbi:PREDICTED: uncharacterized protein LOC107189965 [Dufourea novaeangliae]|uniref:Cyclin-dependent kinase 2-associated protein 1 n=1 Tax=Dufourea novaeangliae TaxID=178035 RepID=A0A154PKH6_DUFNO|nr:PREDICTED: uncharacterized protein LOC107189965 [Dufourea novaeangliae]KZC11808.1 Cyclin-dependent kinase 2-associated protein 1 [Dufourea novaeangliae]
MIRFMKSALLTVSDTKTITETLVQRQFQCKMNDYKWSRSDNASKTNRNSGFTREKRKSTRKTVTKNGETEEQAIIRRFHDAQRMARFRARKKKALEEAKVFEALSFKELSIITELKQKNLTLETSKSIVDTQNIEPLQRCLPTQKSSIVLHTTYGESKYSQLLGIIEELGKDIKLMYAGSKISAERLKVGITQARMLIKECLLDAEINSWQ